MAIIIDNQKQPFSMQPVIRPATVNDAGAILEIYAPFILHTPVTFEEAVPDAGEIASRIGSIMKELPFLVCDAEGTIAGYAYASNHRSRSAYRWTKELSVYVHPDFKRRKIGKALYHCIFELLKYQGVSSVLAGITLPNTESTRFHENMGFVKAAEFHATGFKHGKWHNVGWWELNLNPEMETPPEKLHPFSEIPAAVFQEISEKGRELIVS